MLVETPELEKGSKRSSMILDQFGDPNYPAGPSNGKDDDMSRDQHLSAFLRQEALNHSPHSSVGSGHSGVRASGERGPNGERMPRASFMSNGLEGHTTDSNSPGHTVTRADLRVSAEKILYTYLLPNAEREIILPQGMVNDIITAIEEDLRDDPEVFDAAKDYTFQAMERDAFPGFLRSKALGNLVPPSVKARLVLGLLGMFGGFWAGFACIFLAKPKHIRSWVSCSSPVRMPLLGCLLITLVQLILPFTIGVYCLASQQYSIDPILALLGFSEYTFMNFARIKEPYVRRLLNKRASMVLACTVLIGVAIIILFIFVPGKAL